MVLGDLQLGRLRKEEASRKYLKTQAKTSRFQQNKKKEPRILAQIKGEVHFNGYQRVLALNRTAHPISLSQKTDELWILKTQGWRELSMGAQVNISKTLILQKMATCLFNYSEISYAILLS